MLDLEWEDIAQDDLISIVVYIAMDNPRAAWALKDEIEEKVSGLRKQPKIYKPGRVEGTREIVVRENYIVVYKEDGFVVSVLRVLHAARSDAEYGVESKDE
ncbi:MAG: type II toxin-antitoxin system RelE/ParE family toxin [Deltaproteobacteria bacterium]|jgi:addiction module RelE/StbE family toxin|nr:type II toxin-antitoxin system RelE/ParE family toxin [Deltaproteobacteria bacterium]